MLTQQIRDALTKARKTRSLREIGDASGYNHGQLSRFLAGRRELTTGRKLDRLLQEIGLSATKLR